MRLYFHSVFVPLVTPWSNRVVSGRKFRHAYFSSYADFIVHASSVWIVPSKSVLPVVNLFANSAVKSKFPCFTSSAHYSFVKTNKWCFPTGIFTTFSREQVTWILHKRRNHTGRPEARIQAGFFGCLLKLLSLTCPKVSFHFIIFLYWVCDCCRCNSCLIHAQGTDLMMSLTGKVAC